MIPDKSQVEGWIAIFVAFLWAVREVFGWRMRKRRDPDFDRDALVDEVVRKTMVEVKREVRQAGDELAEQMAEDRTAVAHKFHEVVTRIQDLELDRRRSRRLEETRAPFNHLLIEDKR